MVSTTVEGDAASAYQNIRIACTLVCCMLLLLTCKARRPAPCSDWPACLPVHQRQGQMLLLPACCYQHCCCCPSSCSARPPTWKTVVPEWPQLIGLVPPASNQSQLPARHEASEAAISNVRGRSGGCAAGEGGRGRWGGGGGQGGGLASLCLDTEATFA